MNNVLIIDNQPIMRLGLRLLLERNCNDICLLEHDNINSNLLSKIHFKPAVVILGLNMECDKFDRKNIRSIRQKLPNANLIIYGDNDNEVKICSYFQSGALAYVSKQSTDTEIVRCIEKIFKKKEARN